MTAHDGPTFDEVVGSAPRSTGSATPDTSAEFEGLGEHAPRHAVSIGSRLDDWWGRVLRTPERQRLWYWAGPLGVTLLAAVLRLWDLAYPHSLVFDETFYVKDAWTLLNLGYESAWPDDPNPAFESGDVYTFTTDPSFIAHPPMGKWIIALGFMVFGAESSLGWRISVAVCGILVVFLTTLIARHLFKSTLLATIAGGMLAISGQAIVMSRVTLLDGILTLVVLLGVGAILLDRQWQIRRISQWQAREQALLDGRAATATESARLTDPDAPAVPAKAPLFGPVMWARPWLIVAAVLFGLSASVKWSGLYFLAGFAVYTLVVDYLTRRRLGIRSSFLGVATQAPVSFLLTVPVAFVSYLVTWAGWIFTTGGYYRHWAQTDGEAWNGLLSWVPLWFQNLYHYHAQIYNFHVNLDSEHPYSANPLTWLLFIRPTHMYAVDVQGPSGWCGELACRAGIMDLANPILWWAGVAAMIYLVVRFIRKREWQAGFLLTAFALGYLPWLAYLNRTVFQFYTIAFEPYLILALTMTIGVILGSRTDPSWRRVRGIGIVAVFLVIVVAVSIFYLPLWTGIPITRDFWILHTWLPTWPGP